MQKHWRLAVMFDARDGDLDRLEHNITRAGTAIRAIAANPVRIGIADRHADIAARKDIQDAAVNWRDVDCAVEMTIANERVNDMPTICRALRPLLSEFSDMSTAEVMAGPIFSMVPVRTGYAFLSLAFRRYPGRTSQQFRDWWRKQHSQIAIPVLGPGLLAYDQVHVDQAASRSAADAMGLPYVEYDAYDNLTWHDRDAFLDSCGRDPEGMGRVAADEVGNIDDHSRRHALMREVRYPG